MDGFMEEARRLGGLLKEKGWMMAAAESCTGGLLSAALTEVSGSSEWFLGGVVAYANEVKRDVLGVPEETLLAHGAVSEATVLAMAEGARRVFRADAAVAVSGIAGPSGGTPDKPVGTVWLAWSAGDLLEAARFRFQGSRASVREQSVLAALRGLAARMEERL